MEKVIRLNEETLRQKIRETVSRIIKESEPDEYYYEPSMPESAQDDFDNWGFEEDLIKRYPDSDFEFEVDNDATVKVTDLKTGKYYIGNGEVEYEIVGLGYPSPNDYDSEAEGEVPYYDFTKCFKEIMEKIDNDRPDGVDDSIVDSFNEMSESKQINEKLYGPSPMNVKELGRNNQTLLPAIQAIIEFCEVAAHTPQASGDENVKNFYIKLANDLKDMRINAFESF